LNAKNKSSILEHIVTRAGISFSNWRKQSRKQKIKTLEDIARKERQVEAAVASYVLRSRSDEISAEEMDYMLLIPSPEFKLRAEHLLISPEPAPIKKNDFVKRHIVEFCCGENSKIGSDRYVKDGCSVIRITERDDVTTNKGFYKAIEAVKQENCLLRVSIPCTGGSPWQNINVKRPGGKDKV